MKLTKDSDLDELERSSVRCIVKPTVQKILLPLQIDGLAILYKETPVVGLYDILIESLCRSIRLIEINAVDQKIFSRNGDVGVPETYTFLPKELGHFFSCVYFTGNKDEGEFG